MLRIPVDEAGALVEVSKQGKSQRSTESVYRSIFDKNYEESSYLMEKALRIPELSPEWTEKLGGRLGT